MIHQLSSTANFATKNKFLTWILGGLNYQVEHHLFPKISHIHYPAINKLVRETCQEFNVKYLEYKTLNSAFKSHVSVIQSMSR
ncbi:Fatty acid desaturase [compost metagenome]